MKKTLPPLLGLACLSLVACGSEPQQPSEQIIVREPGEAAPATTEAPAQAGEAGMAVFEVNCSVCHAVEPDASSGIGPNLHDVVGRMAGSRDDFEYSGAMANSGIVWSVGEIEAYIANPERKLPGTSMAGVLVSDPEDRSAITAYLAGLGSE